MSQQRTTTTLSARRPDTLQLTLRDFEPTGGALVGVIVTDGVMVRFDPVLPEWMPALPPPPPPLDPPPPPPPPMPDIDDEDDEDDLCDDDGGPGVSVAPPGNEERIGGYMLPAAFD